MFSETVFIKIFEILLDNIPAFAMFRGHVFNRYAAFLLIPTVLLVPFFVLCRFHAGNYQEQRIASTIVYFHVPLNRYSYM